MIGGKNKTLTPVPKPPCCKCKAQTEQNTPILTALGATPYMCQVCIYDGVVSGELTTLDSPWL